MSDAVLENALARYLIDEWPDGEWLLFSKRYRMAREIIGIVEKGIAARPGVSEVSLDARSVGD